MERLQRDVGLWSDDFRLVILPHVHVVRRPRLEPFGIVALQPLLGDDFVREPQEDEGAVVAPPHIVQAGCLCRHHRVQRNLGSLDAELHSSPALAMLTERERHVEAFVE